MRSLGIQERFDTVEEIPHNKLKYSLCHEEAYISNKFLLAICEQIAKIAPVVGCIVLCSLNQGNLGGEDYWTGFAIAFQEILGWSQLVNYWDILSWILEWKGRAKDREEDGK